MTTKAFIALSGLFLTFNAYSMGQDRYIIDQVNNEAIGTYEVIGTCYKNNGLFSRSKTEVGAFLGYLQAEVKVNPLSPRSYENLDFTIDYINFNSPSNITGQNGERLDCSKALSSLMRAENVISANPNAFEFNEETLNGAVRGNTTYGELYSVQITPELSSIATKSISENGMRFEREVSNSLRLGSFLPVGSSRTNVTVDLFPNGRKDTAIMSVNQGQNQSAQLFKLKR